MLLVEVFEMETLEMIIAGGFVLAVANLAREYISHNVSQARKYDEPQSQEPVTNNTPATFHSDSPGPEDYHLPEGLI
jgi:hypothetical protein